jgi:hypothetical protein
MIRGLAFFRRRSAIALAILFAVSCGGSSTPTTSTPPPVTSVPAPAPTPTPVAAGCPAGVSSSRFTCQGDVPGLMPRLDAAIDKLIADKPQLFNLSDDPGGDRRFRVLDESAFYEGVIANLQAGGLCAQRDYTDYSRIAMKEDNSYSETYDVVGRQTRILRGPERYVHTCTPASFPLPPGDVVARVTVSFFRYTDCPAGTVLPPPPNSIPVGCRGTVTATPKDSLGNKLPPELHGSDITWFVQYGDGTTISTGPSPDGVTFNRIVQGNQAGEFSLCATVAGRTGCLNGQVLP